MKRIILITALCLLASQSEATFELEDPAEIVKEPISEKDKNSIFKKWRGKKEVIVAVGTKLYIPNIEDGQCNSWRLNKTEPFQDENNQTRYTTNTTYMGALVKTIECKNSGGSMKFSLVQTSQDHLMWVESDKVLRAD